MFAAAVNIELVQELARFAAEFLRVIQGAHRCGQRAQHSGDGRVHAGKQHQRPHHQRDGQIRPGLAHAKAVQRQLQRETAERGEKRPHLNRLRIKKRNHHYRAEVIDDGERHQNRHQSRRNAVAEQNQHGNGKGDIGRHRNTPAGAARATGVNRTINQRRDDHAADGGDNRQRRLTKRRQLADHHLVLDFQPDQIKKQRHQAVIDPMMQRHFNLVVTETHRQRLVQQMMIAVAPWRIGDDERRQRTHNQKNPAGGAVAGESLNRRQQLAEQALPGIGVLALIRLALKRLVHLWTAPNKVAGNNTLSCATATNARV